MADSSLSLALVAAAGSLGVAGITGYFGFKNDRRQAPAADSAGLRSLAADLAVVTEERDAARGALAKATADLAVSEAQRGALAMKVDLLEARLEELHAQVVALNARLSPKDAP